MWDLLFFLSLSFDFWYKHLVVIWIHLPKVLRVLFSSGVIWRRDWWV